MVSKPFFKYLSTESSILVFIVTGLFSRDFDHLVVVPDMLSDFQPLPVHITESVDIFTGLIFFNPARFIYLSRSNI